MNEENQNQSNGSPSQWEAIVNALIVESPRREEEENE
jgi:hypothetical protein